MKTFHRVNRITGFVLFVISLGIYWLTMEPALSFWDCGEFIAASYKLQVGHQPGAPLYLIIGKLFSLLSLGNTTKVAYWLNFSSVLASAATIMFLYWTITALALKLFPHTENIKGAENAGLKSKTELWGIVAAGIIGSLTFAVSDTFWFSAVEAEVYALSYLFTAITFWAILKWEQDQNNRWLIFIAFMTGLSIGVHLLNLLIIPILALVYYFKKNTRPTLMGTSKAFIFGCIILGLIQFVIIQYFVLWAAKFDLFFVNTLGFGFGSGAMFFILLLAGLIAYGIHYTIKHKKYNLNLAFICFTFVLLGFSSYFLIIIRANAKPNLNLSNPDNAYSLYEYLGRTNYASAPLLYGQTFMSERKSDLKETGVKYRRGKDKYEIAGKSYDLEYEQNMLFPRVYSDKPQHIQFYRQWMGLAEGESPTFAQNLSFFASYQMGFMYLRYFFWNFVGRQNDIQGHGSVNKGNWLSGIQPLDAMRLGNQKNLPDSITKNEGHNLFYGLPFLLGIAGMIYLYRKNKKDCIVLGGLFFVTGMAIILYLNQDPLQVRERDYVYAGSFYAFTIWIAFGVLALKELASRFAPKKISLIAVSLATLLAVPVLMGVQGWDDHNRSGKTTALDWAANYLNSCAPNAILFTNADNDTFPLWYAQEVEGIRTDVRVVNLQYLSDDAYINQMKTQSYVSSPLPIKMNEDKYVKGVRDYMPFIDYGISDSVELGDLLAVLTSDNQADKVQMIDGSYENFLPTKKLKLAVDKNQLLKTKTISAENIDKITDSMQWTFTKNYAGKADLALFDILVHNNWERPIYFATNVSEDSYIGLQDYLYLEGYAHRLLPYKTDKEDKRMKEEKTNTDELYANFMDKMNFDGFKKARYLDPESRRVLQGTINLANTLTGNLLLERKSAMAARVMKKSMKDFPMRNYSIQDTLNKPYTIKNLYDLNETTQANQLTEETTAFLIQELAYLTSVGARLQASTYLNDIQAGLYVLNSLAQITAENKQTELNHKIKSKLTEFENSFTFSLNS